MKEETAMSESQGAPLLHWRQVHEKNLELAASQAALDHAKGEWLLAADRCGAWVHLGYGSIHEYLRASLWLHAAPNP
jgi:hypothetical protein